MLLRRVMTSRLLLLVLACVALSGAASTAQACEVRGQMEVTTESLDEATETTASRVAADSVTSWPDAAYGFVGATPSPPQLRPPRG